MLLTVVAYHFCLCPGVSIPSFVSPFAMATDDDPDKNSRYILVYQKRKCLGEKVCF